MKLAGALLLFVSVGLLVGAVASFLPLYGQLTGSASPRPSEMSDAFVRHAIMTTACLLIGFPGGLFGTVLLIVGWSRSRARNL